MGFLTLSCLTSSISSSSERLCLFLASVAFFRIIFCGEDREDMRVFFAGTGVLVLVFLVSLITPSSILLPSVSVTSGWLTMGEQEMSGVGAAPALELGLLSGAPELSEVLPR